MPSQPALIRCRLPSAFLFCSALAGVQSAVALQAPEYSAAVTVQPDFYSPAESLNPDLLHVSYSRSPNPVDATKVHYSYQGTETSGSAVSGPENNGTVRAMASSQDEQVWSTASLRYEMTLIPKAGVVLPDTLPLHVLGRGEMSLGGYSSGMINFSVSYRTAPGSAYENVGAISNGVGNLVNDQTVASYIDDHLRSAAPFIRVDETINVAPKTTIVVYLQANAGAGSATSGWDIHHNQYGSASAWVDPVFTLPDEWAGLVDIVGTPVAPPVPEPSAAVMAAAGLGLVARVLRRRRSAAAAH